ALESLREAGLTQLDTLSMGLSGDLEAAIARGATIVRVGTDIFGARPPQDESSLLQADCVNNIRLAFIGAGNIARAIIGGLIAKGYPAELISASATRQETLDEVSRQFGITVSTDNGALARTADVVVLAVKPQMLKAVTLELK